MLGMWVVWVVPDNAMWSGEEAKLSSKDPVTDIGPITVTANLIVSDEDLDEYVILNTDSYYFQSIP